MPDKEKTKLVPTSTEKRKADDIEQIKDLKKVNECKIGNKKKTQKTKNKREKEFSLRTKEQILKPGYEKPAYTTCVLVCICSCYTIFFDFVCFYVHKTFLLFIPNFFFLFFSLKFTMHSHAQFHAPKEKELKLLRELNIKLYKQAH